MIISHKYKFIFIKTYKTAGSSIELYLSKHCGKRDIIIPMIDEDDWDYARNWKRFIVATGCRSAMREILRADRRAIKSGILQLQHSLRMSTFNPDLPLLLKNDEPVPWKYQLVDDYSHIPAREVKDMVGKNIWDDYHVFCVARNTWDRLISFYFWAQHKRAEKGLELSWEEYVERYIRTESYYTDNYRLYSDRNGNSLVNKIIRYENLDEEFEQVCDKLGIPFSAWRTHPKAKATQTPREQDYRSLYTPEVRDLVATNFADEIELMGYKF